MRRNEHGDAAAEAQSAKPMVTRILAPAFGGLVATSLRYVFLGEPTISEIVLTIGGAIVYALLLGKEQGTKSAPLCDVLAPTTTEPMTGTGHVATGESVAGEGDATVLGDIALSPARLKVEPRPVCDGIEDMSTDVSVTPSPSFPARSPATSPGIPASGPTLHSSTLRQQEMAWTPTADNERMRRHARSSAASDVSKVSRRRTKYSSACSTASMATRSSRTEFRQKSVVPITPPKFTCIGMDAQVCELISEITPTPEVDEVVQQIVEQVRRAIIPLLPEADVSGFASGSLARGKAFGVAIPEVDIVINVEPAVLIDRLPALKRLPEHVLERRMNARKLQKSAIRACTDELVTTAGFKFRRSAFRALAPKVTLLVPSTFGFSNDAIPVDFSVNNATPLHAAALLTECGQLEPRAKDLILLVRRWARDRGISHAAKGHMPPYAWSLLAIYYLQVGNPEHGPLLPPLKGFNRCASLAGRGGTPCIASNNMNAWRSPDRANAGQKSVAQLFKGFANFYYAEFRWRHEGVSVRAGCRQPPGPQLPISVVEVEGGGSEVRPSVEDPFDVRTNLGNEITTEALERLKEEIERAHNLCSLQCMSLSKLLDPWVPPEQDTQPDRSDEDASTAFGSEGLDVAEDESDHDAAVERVLLERARDSSHLPLRMLLHSKPRQESSGQSASSSSFHSCDQSHPVPSRASVLAGDPHQPFDPEFGASAVQPTGTVDWIPSWRYHVPVLDESQNFLWDCSAGVGGWHQPAFPADGESSVGPMTSVGWAGPHLPSLVEEYAFASLTIGEASFQ